MKKTKRAIYIILGLVIIIILAGVVYQRELAQRAVPDYNKNLNLKGLKEEVTVYRDSLGIPHILARNQKDLYRATGYVMAQDRLWQMDLLRRVTLGRLSEMFGRDFVQTDLLFRALRFTQKSNRLLDSISPGLKHNLKAFTHGINQFMADHQDKLPPEFALLGYQPEPWKIQHTLNLIGYMAWDLSGSWNVETILFKLKNKLDSAYYSDLLPEMDLLNPAIYPNQQKAEAQLSNHSLLEAGEKVKKLGLHVFTGSNNWAVAPSKSKNGHAMLANDMHLGLNIPGIWMQMHQMIPGEVNVTGVALPGAPFIIDGHNNNIAWGMTNVMLDDIDFYHETVHPEDSNRYKVNGQWREMRVQKEQITLDDGSKVERKIRFTHRGPVISTFKDTRETISMHWIGNEHSNELRTIYLLNYAINWQDFKNAVRSFRAISQNIAYADKAGNIGIYTCAGVPKRKTPGYHVFPGDTTRYDWQGFVPFDSLPHAYNPERGYVYSSNNKITGPDYPYYISYWYDMPYRARRINGFLSSHAQLSINDLKSLQTDQLSLMAKDMVPVFMQMLENAELTATEKEALSLLANWQYQAKAGKAAPLIFEETVQQLIKRLLLDEMGKTLYQEYLNKDLLSTYLLDKLVKGQQSPWTDDINTPDTRETLQDLVAPSFRAAVKAISNKLGSKPAEWQWGALHQLTLKHPLSEVELLNRLFKLNRGPYPVGGTFNTVSPNSFSFNAPYAVDHGASQRHIYPAGAWEKSLTVIPTGTSGIPESPHYCDQTEMYVNLKYHRDLFTLNAVKKNHRYLMKLLPE